MHRCTPRSRLLFSGRFTGFYGSPQPSLSAEEAMQQISSQYPALGQFLGINGTLMHIRCQGSGSPAVIMEAGCGDRFDPFGCAGYPGSSER